MRTDFRRHCSCHRREFGSGRDMGKVHIVGGDVIHMKKHEKYKHIREIVRIFHQRYEALRKEVAREYIEEVILSEGFSDEDSELAKEILEEFLT